MNAENDETVESHFESRFGNGRLRLTVELLRNEVGDDKEVIRQVIADLAALDRQNLQNNFEARLEYQRQVGAYRHATLRGIVEYGLQTLKWSFLLNAGAIAVVMAYVGTAVSKATCPASIAAYMPLIGELWPFVVGCLCVALAGAAGFFNWSYSAVSLPSEEALHNFLAPTSKTWPIPMARKEGESDKDYIGRFIRRKMNLSRHVAIAFGLGSAVLFAVGVFLVTHAALIGAAAAGACSNAAFGI